MYFYPKRRCLLKQISIIIAVILSVCYGVEVNIKQHFQNVLGEIGEPLVLQANFFNLGHTNLTIEWEESSKNDLLLDTNNTQQEVIKNGRNVTAVLKIFKLSDIYDGEIIECHLLDINYIEFDFKIFKIHTSVESYISSVDQNEVYVFGILEQPLVLQANFINLSHTNLTFTWTSPTSLKESNLLADTQEEVIKNGRNVTAVLKIFKLSDIFDEEKIVCHLLDTNYTVFGFKSFEIYTSDRIFYLNDSLWAHNNHRLKYYAKLDEKIHFLVNGFGTNLDDWFLYTREQTNILYPEVIQEPQQQEFRTQYSITHLKTNVSFVVLSSNDKTTILTIKKVKNEDSGFYSTFGVERQTQVHETPLYIFELKVLPKLIVSMRKSYYFQNASDDRMHEISCDVGISNKTVQFSMRCDPDAHAACDYYLPQDNVNVTKSTTRPNFVTYTLTYKFKYPGIVNCSVLSTETHQLLDSAVTQVSIGPYSTVLSISKVDANNKSSELTDDDIDGHSLSVNVGEKLVLQCAVLGESNQLTWWHGGNKILNGEYADEDFLLTEADEPIGLYKYKLKILILEIKKIKQNNTNGIYTCESVNTNTGEQMRKSIMIFSKESKMKPWIITLCVLSTILLPALLWIGFYRYRYKQRRNHFDVIGLSQLRDSTYISKYEFIHDLPYDKTFEFPAMQLKLGKCLGCGNFGMVHEGIAKNIAIGEKKTLVAVKTVKDLKDREALRCLISEMKIMIHLGKNINVVNLLGAVTTNIHRGELMVIVEYCPYGNLESFLRMHRNKFINQIDPITDKIDDQIIKDVMEGENIPDMPVNLPRPSTSHGYVPCNTALLSTEYSTASTNKKQCGTIPGAANTKEDRSRGNDCLTTTDLILWAYQISNGMNFISSRNIMHGDLAARNILLAEDNVVKICDFGLAKSIIGEYGNYHKQQDGLLPLKWLALESLQDNDFSIKSDVWSFGILMWELFSLGCSPYPVISARGLEFLNLLKNGYRMEKPEFANHDLYKIMLKCWEAAPANRPKFSALSLSLTTFIDEDVYTYYINKNEPYLRANEEYFRNKSNDYLVMLNLPHPTDNTDYVSQALPEAHTSADVTHQDAQADRSTALQSSTSNLQFDIKDKDERGSPCYQNNFNSLRKQKKSV